HCLYAHGFRFYFTPLTGVLFAFPSRYWFTIGQSGVFSLGGWSPHLHTGFLVSRTTQYASLYVSNTGLSPTMASFPTVFFDIYILRLLPVRSPLLGESLLMSFPKGTEMFHFPSFAFQ